MLRKLLAMIVAVTRLGKTATDIALARMDVAKTSDTTTQLPGPNPMLKKAR